MQAILLWFTVYTFALKFLHVVHSIFSHFY